jgi:hypothetical protein
MVVIRSPFPDVEISVHRSTPPRPRTQTREQVGKGDDET